MDGRALRRRRAARPLGAGRSSWSMRAAARAGDLERLSAAAIRHRRLSGALVRGHAGAQPRRRLRPHSSIAGAPLAFWPVLLLQAALTVWVLALMLRAHGFGRRPLLLLGIVAALSVFTTLPWLTAHPAHRHLRRARRARALSAAAARRRAARAASASALIALIAFSAATHSATFAVLLALLVAAALGAAGRPQAHAARRHRPRRHRARARRRDGARRQLRGGRAARLDAGRLRALVRPHAAGRHRHALSRRPLPRRQRCKLCAYKDAAARPTPTSGSGAAQLFNKLGRFEGLGDEMATSRSAASSTIRGCRLKTAAARHRRSN